MKKIVHLFTVLILSLLAMASLHSHAEISIVYYHNDLLGSPVAATDESGDVLWREDYTPYGEKLSDEMEAVIEKVGYTGHRYDSETGLVYAGARMYDPNIGRFMGIDPVGALAAVDNPVMFNRYAYGNNNPYKYVDPDGESPILIGAIVGAVINSAVYVATADFSNMSAGQIASGLGRSALIGGAVGAATTVGAGAAVAAKLGAARTVANVAGAGFLAGGAGEIASQSIAAGKLSIGDGGAVLASATGNSIGAGIGLMAAKPITSAMTKSLSDAGSDGTGATIRSLRGRPFKPRGYRPPKIVSPSQSSVDVASEVAGGTVGSATADKINDKL